MSPSEYEWVGSTNDNDEHSFDFSWERFAELTIQPELSERGHGDNADIPWAPTDAGGCAHCGKRNFSHWSFFLHKPSGEVVKIGQRCAANLGFNNRPAEARAKERAKEQATANAEAWAQNNVDEHAFLSERHERATQGKERPNEFYESLWNQLANKGGLSEKQLAALQRGIQKRADLDEQRAAEQALNPDPDPTPCPKGRETVMGRLVSTKWSSNAFGERQVMTVIDDRGFKVWGTLSGEMEEVLDRLCEQLGADNYTELLHNHRVHVGFAATLEPSDRDETFGFLKRPSGGSAREL
jgi:hypothetical protein